MQTEQKQRSYGKFYTTTRAARLCNVSHSTIFRAIQQKKLKAFSTPGGHFRVSPEDLQEFAHQNSIPISGWENRRHKVLIIEDNPAELRLLRRVLEKDPYMEIQSVELGFRAGFMMQVFKPDLIILDIYLKDMDGREIIRLVRTDPVLKGAQIVVVTSAKDPKEIADIKKASIDHFIAKPIDPKTFLSEIKSFL
jgi:excisionase family DNA binding protein